MCSMVCGVAFVVLLLLLLANIITTYYDVVVGKRYILCWLVCVCVCV